MVNFIIFPTKGLCMFDLIKFAFQRHKVVLETPCTLLFPLPVLGYVHLFSGLNSRPQAWFSSLPFQICVSLSKKWHCLLTWVVLLTLLTSHPSKIITAWTEKIWGVSVSYMSNLKKTKCLRDAILLWLNGCSLIPLLLSYPNSNSCGISRYFTWNFTS